MTEGTLGAELAQLTAEYEIVGELGRGGSAVVYRGRDRGLGRDVAIKVVHPRPLSPDDDAVARLAREARTVAQLQHPNIVTVFAVRSLSGGGLALVMQLVPGRTLKAIVHQDGAFSADRCERVLRDVASALAYAHARGVVHRDVKPENIFVDEETGRALLSDFGIARSAEHDSMTLTGTAIGTPFYMSPEQIDGAAIDGRSDLYSLGLVAWEMLTGQRPWDGESLYNVIYKQKHEELPPIEALRTGIPTRLQYIVERMLQKNRAARWAGAEGLLVQLSHTVLPGDYGRWQATLRRRVERYRVAEREREKAAAEQATVATTGLIASTMRFVRGGSSGKAAAKPKEGAAPVPGLANTMVVRRGEPVGNGATTADALPVAPDIPTTVAVATEAAEPVALVEEHGTIEPNWSIPGAASRGRRWALGGAGVIALGALGLLAVARRGDTAWLFGGSEGREPNFGTALAPVPPSSGAAATGSNATPPAAASDPGAVPAASTAPLRLAAAPRTVLSLGGRHSCAVTIDGSVQCWGANERGQLGDGTAQRQLAPARVAAELSFASVSAGSLQSCGVTRTGDVYCWGNDSSGQLGDATTVRRNAPVRVAGPGIYRSVSSGDAHTCGITAQDGIHCWGANGRGQVGDGTTTTRTIPTTVTLPRSDGIRFVQVVAGAMHSCALSSEGEAFCWGANERGQLGVDAAGDRHAPTPVAGRARFVSLAAGQQYTCGLAENGVVSCWGSNARGQLGGGARTGSARPQAIRLPLPAVSIAAGGQHACALVATGEAYCWGANGGGQLGTGTMNDAMTPVRVAAPEPFTTLAAGPAHTCAVGASGALLCWGSNAEGQIGDATRVNRLLPTRVAFADGAPTRSSAPSTAR